MSPKEYPSYLETRWVRRAREVTGLADDEAALEKLRPAVRALSDLFTTERPDERFPNYAADAAKRVAYGLFFFPQSYVKCSLAIDPLLRFRGWKPGRDDAPVRILDLGSASGPCGLAAAIALADATGRRVELTALDHSAEALAELRDLVAETPELRSRITVATHAGDLRRVAESVRELPAQDLIVVGFAANEVFGGADTATRLGWATGLAKHLAPDGLLLVLEPALRETAEPLRRMRDATLAGPVIFPLGPDVAATPCTMLPSHGKHWDHEVREWTAPESLEFLNRKLHRDTRVLKFTWVAFGLRPMPPPEAPRHLLRIISPFDSQKGGFAFIAVTREGEQVKIDVPSRALSKSECKRYAASWERGDIAGCDEWHALTNARHYRVSGPEILQKIYSP